MTQKQPQIIDQQTRFVEAGRIRLGKRGARGFPEKINKLRFTSQSKDLIDQVAHFYGGEPHPWTNPSNKIEQHEVFIELEEIDVIVPPTPNAITTSYELWSGGGWQRMCDGRTARLPNDTADYRCFCDSAEESGQDRACKMKARLLLWLPKIQTYGVWRLETGSWYAAGEMLTMTNMLLRASFQLQKAVTAKLRLDQRVVKREGQTFRFNVPIITPVGDVSAVLTASAPSYALPEARSIAERPALPAVTAPPSDFTEVETEVIEDVEEVDEQTGEITSRQPGDIIAENTHKSVMIAMRAVNVTDDERHEMVEFVTDGRTKSSKELRYEDESRLWERLTARAMSQVHERMKILFRDMTQGWEQLHESPGLGDPVKSWRFAQWVHALEVLDKKVEEMDEDIPEREEV